MHTVEELMSTPVHTANANDVIGPLRDVMLERGIHAVPIVDDNERPVGIITSTDLVEEWAPDMGVRTVMTRELVTVGPHTTLTDAARTMVDHRVHHLVVMSGRGGIAGMLSSFDLLRHLAGRVEELAAQQVAGVMRAEVGDTIVVRPTLAGGHERRAKVVTVHGPDGTGPFTVRWSDDPHDEPKLTLFFPGNDAYVEPTESVK